MPRKIKLTIAVLSAVVASAFTAAGATAQEGQLTSDGPVFLQLTQTGGAGANAFTAFEDKTECPEAVYTGHKYNETPRRPIPSGAKTQTWTAHPGPCTTSGGSIFPSTVEMNGCDFVVHIGQTTVSPGTYGLTLTTQCPIGSHIRITQFSSSSHAFKLCTQTYTTVHYLGSLHVTNITTDLRITGTVQGTVHRSGLCGSATDVDGTIHLDLLVKGENETGGATAISISD